MKRIAIAGAAFVAVLVLLFLAGNRGLAPDVDARPSSPPTISATTPANQVNQGVLYGRVVSDDGTTYEGRLRFGGDEEAFWSHYFNGFKNKNPWATYAPPERLTEKRPPFRVFGLEVALGDRQIDLGRPLMVRFGDIARIAAASRDLQVTLKSGTVFHLDRYAADDFADGLRVWDARHGVVNLDEWRIRSIEFLSTAGTAEAAVTQLHGTVRTVHGDFTGFIQWDRSQSVGSDTLAGRTPNEELRLRFDSIRSIARHSSDSSQVTLLDGREMVLSGTRDVGEGHSGIYVDDRRYGRVLISWDAFDRVDFSAGGGAPAYNDFPRGGPLRGSVITRDGRRLTGRLVYDLDESETTETLDAPAGGVDYTILFGRIASISPAGRAERGSSRATVTLHGGEQLQLDRTGDLGEGNAGMLIFVDGHERPDYVPWDDVEQVDFDRPPVMYPPLSVP